jgi:hypothetical protein
MNERTMILRDPAKRTGRKAEMQKSGIARLMDFVMEKFDAVAALFYKWTNS